MDWHARVRSAFGATAPDDDVVEELAQHAADAWQARVNSGLSAESADREISAQLAAWAAEAKSLRHPRRPPTPPPPAADGERVVSVWQDVRYAARVLLRQPAHSLAAVLTMALGLGAATIIVSVLYGVLVKPLPWPDADKLVRLSETRRGGTTRFGAIFTNGTYHAWRENPATVEGLAAWSGENPTLTGNGEPRRLEVTPVTASLFPLLRARPELGRLFTADDEVSGSGRVIVLSHRLWKARFGGDRNIIGQALRLDGESVRVIGVMPRSFVFPDADTEAWTPFVVPRTAVEGSEGYSLSMFRALARLKPGATPEQAAAEGAARGEAAAGPNPPLVINAVFGSRGPVEVSAVPYLTYETAKVRPAILVFLAAVALLLLTATANVANLQLTRATGRRREMAIRAAIGAGAWRLARQSLVESTLLALAGGAVGLLLAAWLQQALPDLLPATFPRVDDIGLQVPVLAAAALLTLLSGLAFGLLPALQAGRVNLVSTLSEDGMAPVGGSARSRTSRARMLLITGQVAIGCVLLIGGALLGRSFQALLTADRGYNPEHVLTATVSLPEPGYTPQRRMQLVSTLLEQLSETPGITVAGITTTLPLKAGESLAAFPLPAKTGVGTVRAQVAVRIVSPGYLDALGYRRVAGRGFLESDTATSVPVVLVNRAFVREYLNEPAVGQQIPAGFSTVADKAEIVGVLDDVRHRGATDPPHPEMYICYQQLSKGFEHSEPTLVARSTGDPRALLPTLRRVVAAQDPTLVLDDVMTMSDRVNRSVAEPRLYAVLLGGFAAFAVAIAGVGLFGVLAYSVAQRSREIGVRSALGARPRDIVALVLKQAAAMAVTGLAIGVAASFAFLRSLGSFLYGVTAYDPWTYSTVVIVLLALAGLACAIPARRAARMDPLRALRS